MSLSSVKSTHKLQMDHALGNLSSNSGTIHLRVIQSPIKQAEGSARRRSDNPIRILSIHQCHCIATIAGQGKIPSRAIGLGTSEVKSIEAFDTKRTFHGLVHQSASTIGLDEGDSVNVVTQRLSRKSAGVHRLTTQPQ